MKKITPILLLLASPLLAQQHPHDIYPSDFTVSPCATDSTCESFTDVSFESAAFKFLLRTLQKPWIEAHQDEMFALVQPYCVKRATCMASPGRLWWFCNDVYSQELRIACDAKYNAKTQPSDNEQCHTWADTYMVGVDQHGSAEWKKLQECGKQHAPQSAGLRKMDWWQSPAMLPVDYKGQIQVFAIDTETHVPVEAEIAYEGQIVYSWDSPSGKPTTYYAIKWPRKLTRVPNADGHTDVVPTTMTMTAPGYEVVTVPVPTIVPKAVVTMAPPIEQLHSGVNHITVTANDATTGKPLEGQVYLGTQTIGFTNKPLDLTIEKKSKRPEIWIRSPFDAFSDVVVAPAQK